MIAQISAADRFQAIEAYTAQFREHLIQNPGAVLPPSLRPAIVHFDREAISCSACADKLPQGACLKPGTDLYGAIEAIEHSTKYEEPQSIPEAIQKVLLTIVHSVVNHQGRLDQGWYDSVIEAILQTEDILPVEGDEKKRQYLAYAAFSEIVLLAAMSHGMNVAFWSWAVHCRLFQPWK